MIALARAVMVLGDGIGLSAAAELAEIDQALAARAADLLMRHHIFASEAGLSLVHPIVRAAIAADMTPAELGAWHSRAARILIAHGAAEDRVAAQLSGRPRPGRRASRRAAAPRWTERPRQGVADDRSQLPSPRPGRAARPVDRRPGLGRARNRGAARRLSVGGGRPPAPCPRTQPRSGSRADRTIKLWLALLQTGGLAEGIALLEETIEEVADFDREAGMLLEGELFLAALFDTTRLREIWARLDRFADLPGETPAERRLLASLATKSFYTGASPAAHVAELARRAVHGGLLIKENTLESSKWLWGVGWLIVTDQIEKSEAALELAHATATAAGSIEGFLFVYDLRALLRLRQGRLTDAETDAQLVLDVLRDVEATPVRDLLSLVMVRWLCSCSLERGNAEHADRLHPEDRRVAPVERLPQARHRLAQPAGVRVRES